MRCGAVPFEEDDRDTKIWFLDHSYLEQMYRMFKKVNGVPPSLVGCASVRECLAPQGHKERCGPYG